jgi:cytochrome c-type biogenesis protein CcmH/NrfG
LLVAARGDVHTMPLPIRMRLLAAALTLVLGGFSSIGLIGNLALASSGRAAAQGNWTKVEAATRTARKFAPWSSAPWQMLGEAQVRRGDLRGARASFRAAIAKDGRNWFLWFDLAGASRGPARMYALARALRLNPLSPEIAGSYTAKRSSRRGGSRSSR